jgi:hypothetical protein
MASIVQCIGRFAGPGSLSVDFVYSIAAYQDPPRPASRNADAGPVSPAFAGWWTQPERSLSAIVGLGYEQDKALGAVEHLQISEIWVLRPMSVIGEYDEALLKANSKLLEFVPQFRRLPYRVDQPYDTFHRLESLVNALIRESNPVLLPFGPKIFSLCALLCSCLHREVPVWRISAGRFGTPRDVIAHGAIYGIRVQFMNR